MKIESKAFTHGEMIPKVYTCEGENLSPPLNFSDVPSNTKSLAIIVDDPDAPKGTFDHWIAWNIPVTEKISEGVAISKTGLNGYGESGYRGPCPPPGQTHRYFFKVYALDVMLDLAGGSTKEELEVAIKPHLLGSAELIGRYKKVGS